MRRTWLFASMRMPLAAILTTIIVAGCAGSNKGEWVVLTPDTPNKETTMRVTGTIRHMKLEGGEYVIRTPEGVNFNPKNLPEDFKTDGIQVEADILRRNDMASTKMTGPIVDIVQIRRLTKEDRSTRSNPLLGTAWKLERIGGKKVLEEVEVTLEFREDEKIAGKGSCNSFFGQMTTSGENISFSGIGSTKMACSDERDAQESNYFSALEKAERFEIEDSRLLIYYKGQDKPLQLVRIVR